MSITQLKKRQFHQYQNDINFDSISNFEKINYPINKFIVCKKMETNMKLLLEQIILNALDYIIKSVDDLILLAVSFHELSDYQHFIDIMEFTSVFNLNSSISVKYLFH